MDDAILYGQIADRTFAQECVRAKIGIELARCGSPLMNLHIAMTSPHNRRRMERRRKRVEAEASR